MQKKQRIKGRDFEEFQATGFLTLTDASNTCSVHPVTSAVVDYNNHMNAVDKLDQNTLFDENREQDKWYMRLVLKMVE